MIDPSALITNLVALLRDIPELVAEMAGDPALIYAYHDEFEVAITFTEAGDD